MAQKMIGENARRHRFAYGYGANPDARIVTPPGDDLRFLAFSVDRSTRRQDRRRGFHDETDHDVLT